MSCGDFHIGASRSLCPGADIVESLSKARRGSKLSHMQMPWEKETYKNDKKGRKKTVESSDHVVFLILLFTNVVVFYEKLLSCSCFLMLPTRLAFGWSHYVVLASIVWIWKLQNNMASQWHAFPPIATYPQAALKLKLNQSNKAQTKIGELYTIVYNCNKA